MFDISLTVDWESPQLWRWLWLGTVLFFALGELAIPTSFFLLSFAVGALVATVVAFAGGPLALQWILFVGVSAASLLALRPLSRRLDRTTVSEATIGAHRWSGKRATVLTDIPGPDDVGSVRLGSEEWRATSADARSIPAGTRVRVVDVEGTRLVVTADLEPEPDPNGPPGSGDVPPDLHGS